MVIFSRVIPPWELMLLYYLLVLNTDTLTTENRQYVFGMLVGIGLPCICRLFYVVSNLYDVGMTGMIGRPNMSSAGLGSTLSKGVARTLRSASSMSPPNFMQTLLDNWLQIAYLAFDETV